MPAAASLGAAGPVIPALSLAPATVVSPCELSESAGGAASGRLCHELLRLGILVEGDWAGTFVETLHLGLKRWVNEVKGASTWRVLDTMDVYLSDDCRYADAPAEWVHDWCRRFGDTDNRTVGLIGLCANSVATSNAGIRELWCREGIESLESLAPGAGYSVLNLLSWALEFTTPAITFNWARVGIVGDRQRGTKPSPTDLTIDALEEHIPEEACHWQFDRQDICDALDALGSRGGRMAVALNAALRLDDLLRQIERRWSWLSHLRVLEKPEHGGHHHVGYPCLLFRWDPEDVMPRVCDEIMHNAVEEGTGTTRAWMHGWQFGHPGTIIEDQFANRRQAMSWVSPVSGRTPDGSLAAAFDALSLTLDVLGRCDEILRCIRSDAPKDRPGERRRLPMTYPAPKREGGE